MAYKVLNSIECFEHFGDIFDANIMQRNAKKKIRAGLGELAYGL